ncbi:RNA polymerase sigma factor [Ruminococcus sp.]|uniref:RNA polymerase sigma factor n=1 Tax=Ruminococcus sp. TaxID=41978 RepID=UPI0038703346
MSDSVGTEKEIEKVIMRYADMIFRIAYQNLKSRADAEDIFQEVCVALLTKDAPLDDEKHLKHWIIRVTINKCNNFHKSFWRNKVEPIDQYTELIQPETKSVMEELWQLPKNYRNVIYLYYYEEYSIAEIARILGKNQNTVSSQLQRARAKLGKILSEGGN